MCASNIELHIEINLDMSLKCGFYFWSPRMYRKQPVFRNIKVKRGDLPSTCGLIMSDRENLSLIIFLVNKVCFNRWYIGSHFEQLTYGWHDSRLLKFLLCLKLISWLTTTPTWWPRHCRHVSKKRDYIHQILMPFVTRETSASCSKPMNIPSVWDQAFSQDRRLAQSLGWGRQGDQWCGQGGGGEEAMLVTVSHGDPPVLDIQVTVLLPWLGVMGHCQNMWVRVSWLVYSKNPMKMKVWRKFAMKYWFHKTINGKSQKKK